jgi:hypothetical protein
MTMGKNDALWLQKLFAMLNEDEWGAISLTQGTLSSIPDNTRERWQFGVDMYYRLRTSDLIAVSAICDIPNISSLQPALRDRNPFTNEGSVLWNGTQIFGTKLLNNVVETHFPQGGEYWTTLNPGFVEAIDTIFTQNGVPRLDSPLLPIRPERVDERAGKLR